MTPNVPPDPGLRLEIYSPGSSRFPAGYRMVELVMCNGAQALIKMAPAYEEVIVDRRLLHIERVLGYDHRFRREDGWLMIRPVGRQDGDCWVPVWPWKQPEPGLRVESTRQRMQRVERVPRSDVGPVDADPFELGADDFAM